MTDFDPDADPWQGEDPPRWRLHHGEALRYLEELPTGTVDAVITDPPYSSGGFTRGDRMGSAINKYVHHENQHDRADFFGDNRDQRGFVKWCAVWLDEALRVTVPGGSLLMFSDWRQLPSVTDAVQAGGWVWRGIVPWDKGEGTRPRRGGFRSQAEYAVWATAGGLRTDHEAYLPGWIHVPVAKSDKHHITGKPTDLMRELVKVAPLGGTILDPFAGSGTTGVAALLEGRRFVGVEKSTHYAEVSRRRLAETDQQPALFDEAPPMTPPPDPLFELEEPEEEPAP